jgi:hypothetical protein
MSAAPSASRPRGLAGPKVRAPAPCRPRREDFRGQYARPRETQAHNLAEQAVEAAFTAPDPQQGRLRFDALRWYASKLLPKVYGERVEVEQTTRQVIVGEPPTEDEWLEKHGDKSAPEWIAKFGDKSSPGPERAH